MIVSDVLLSTLQAQLTELLADLRARVENEPEVGDKVRAEYAEAFDAERTGWTFTEWSEDRLTQVAVGWLLACVFVRFCEDNGLLDDAMIAGVGARGDEAKAAQTDFFRAHPHSSDRDYLHHVFATDAARPGLGGVLGRDANPLWLVDPSADACSALLALWRATDDDGALAADFTSVDWDTRFLGDLYQDLSEHAKKTYALLQTPVFVEEFILDRTLEPAIESHGLARTTLIDPTCGSGHFLLGAFERLWQRWTDAEPAMDPAERARRALDAVWGVDINPFAAAIARFRLLVAGLRRCGQRRLVDAPDLPIHVAVGDSLLWGGFVRRQLPGFEGTGGDHIYAYRTENAADMRAFLGRSYSAVVGNPPYINPPDKQANANYRALWDSCHRQYQLGTPFTELFFDLAAAPNPASGTAAGFVGLINSDAFMKREFGKKLIEQFIPQWDLTHVVHTSGAYIPGHGTPTVILFGRNQAPVADTVRSVMGIRGEPTPPEDPTKGLVWSAIVAQIDEPGSESDYISVADTERSRFANHPWSIGGGGAAELKERLDEEGSLQLRSVVTAIGDTGRTSADEQMIVPSLTCFARRRVEDLATQPLVSGEVARDWTITKPLAVVFPYSSSDLIPIDEIPGTHRWLWPYRTTMGNRATFSKVTYFEEGRPWWEWHQVALDRLRTPLSIAFAFVATHNHFVLDRGGKVFKQSAPVIKLPEGATVEDHLGLLALLNSSVACFWMQQVFHNKGYGADSKGARQTNVAWENFFEFDGTKLQQFPLPDAPRPVGRGRELDDLAQQLSAVQPSAVAAAGIPTRAALDAARADAEQIEARMVAAQEELDWHCLHLYGLTDEPLTVPDGTEPPPLQLGERAFEIILARQVAAGDTETAWFTRHRSTPITALPSHWPDWYRDLVNRRIALIESDRNVGLVERPENKRRWNRTPWEDLEATALRDWLLDRLEDRSLWFDGDRAVVRSVAQLADRVSTDDDWISVACTWKGQPDVDPVAVVAELIADEHVPAQAAARYKPSGMAKRAEWERTWELQRAEDRGEDVGRIAVPPKYTSSDFRKPSYWRQRGKLDVPKERFTSVHGAERDAGTGESTTVLAWAGFDHAQSAQALATLLHQRQTVDGWTGDRLVPLIAALDEELAWVAQWHPDVDPALGQPLAVFYRGMVDGALASIGATTDTLRTWAPPAATKGRKKTTD